MNAFEPCRDEQVVSRGTQWREQYEPRSKPLRALAGDFAAARPLSERALAICENTLGSEHPNTNRARCNLSRVHLMSGQPTEALTLGETALAAHDKALGRDHAWTKDSARVTADALDALGRTEEAKALRERYGLTGPEKPKSS